MGYIMRNWCIVKVENGVYNISAGEYCHYYFKKSEGLRGEVKQLMCFIFSEFSQRLNIQHFYDLNIRFHSVIT